MEPFDPKHHTLILLKDFLSIVEQGFPFDQSPVPDEDESFLLQLKAIILAFEERSEEGIFAAQAWLSRLFRNYPGFAPYLNRDVLWLMGGEALHFMAEEELQLYQRLDDAWQDALLAGQPFDFNLAKEQLLKQQS